MGSSRAITPGARRRAASRQAAGQAPARRPAAKRPAARGAAKPPVKRAPAKKAPVKKAPPKPKAKRSKPASKPSAKPSVKRQPKSLRARAGWIAGTALILVALLASAYVFWFRSSSLVAVEQVTVTGMTGPERTAAEDALRQAAAEMTTLNVDSDALERAVAGLSTVVGVEASADFPHALAITVTERPPVLIATAGGQVVPIAGDGTLLPDVDVTGQLPRMAVGKLPAEGKVSGDALEVAAVMGGAPPELRELVAAVESGGAEGVTITLRGDIPVYFGSADAADVKWAASAAVLADSKIRTLTYVDVRVPERPAIGGAAPPVTESTTETTEPETPVVTPEEGTLQQ